MIALPTIFALAYGIGGGWSALISSSPAMSVIGSLITSTFFTLLVVPLLLALMCGRRKKGWQSPA
jgi:hydrophobic/amphiphilic exporter-1 (mainly G- bacteria), HAE1 family